MSRSLRSNSASSQSNNAAELDTPVSIEDNSTATEVLTRADMFAALDKLRTDFNNDVEVKLAKQTAELRLIIEEQKAEIEQLKVVITNQAAFIEKLEFKNRSENVIINNVVETNGENLKIVIENTLQKLNIPDVQIDKKHRIFRLGQSIEGKIRPIKIKLKSTEMVRTLITKSREMPDPVDGSLRIYMNYDQPLLTRKENNRLRLRKKEITEQNPGSMVKISKGKLMMGDTQVDVFDLKNQIF